MQIKKLFTMTCYFCEVSETIDMPSQRRAVVKFFDDGWRVRADEDVCPKCTSMLPLKVSRRELLETKERLLTKRAADAGESPAQQALFTPEAGSAAGKLPTPTPRR